MTMKKILKITRNLLFLSFGLGVIGFSAYRLVLGVGQTNQDTIGGQEIVVISENTPVVSTSVSETGAGQLVTGSSSAGISESPAGPDGFPSSATPFPTNVTNTPGSNPVQDTFLTEIEKKPKATGIKQEIPDRIVIPTILLNAQVVVAGSRTVKVSDQTFDQWEAPNQFAAGWHGSSAYLGEKGNTVINGHHNEYGKVFGNLINLKPGETIYVYSGGKVFTYIISNKIILKEKNEDLKARMENASWIQSSTDERLTLITCWPPETNTHRLIIVAVPYVSSPERVIG
jgi:LPXTG-site transpeptidase (sortase) family protein